MNMKCICTRIEFVLGLVFSLVVVDVELTWSNTINVLDPLLE